jgi:hypothetical protein
MIPRKDAMKINEFTGLCQREWEDGRGDVCGLSLTDDSLRELTVDAAAEGGIFSSPATDSAGLLLTELPNPVTRSTVKVSAGVHFDMVQVSRALSL